MKKQDYTSVQHIIKYIGIFGSVEALKILANLLRGKFTAKFLGIFGTGLIAIYQNILEFIRSCTNLGLETASIQKLSEIDVDTQQEEVKSMTTVIRTWSLSMAILGSVACLVVYCLLGNFFLDDEQEHWKILLLAPACFLAPITAGECAILKGTHKLKSVATVELFGAIGTVISTLSIYGVWGVKGILPTINLCIAIEAFIHLYFCTRNFPYHVSFSRAVWHKGLPLLKFGIPYAITALMGAITTTLLYKIITSTNEVGLYKTGYALILYYVGVIFSSNSTDYFPRLSSVCHNLSLKNETVNKQIQVSFTITTPLVMAFLLALPLIIVVLYTKEFMPISVLCVMAGLFQLHKAVALPLEYVSLAHGHSWMFLILESLYNVMIIVSSYFLYNLWGLAGLGLALSLVGLGNTVILSIVNKFFYHIDITRRNWFIILCGTMLVAIVMLICMTDNLTLRLSAGIPLTLLTAISSLWSIRKDIRNE